MGVEIKQLWADIRHRQQKIDNRLASADKEIARYHNWAQETFEEQPNIPQNLKNNYEQAYQEALTQQKPIKDYIANKAQNYNDINRAERDYDRLIGVLQEKQLKVLEYIDPAWHQQITEEEEQLTKHMKSAETKMDKILEMPKSILDAHYNSAINYANNLGIRFAECKTFARTTKLLDFTERAERLRDLGNVTEDFRKLDEYMGTLLARYNSENIPR
jgi:hypothetical protein